MKPNLNPEIFDELYHDTRMLTRYHLYETDHDMRENPLYLNEIIRASDEDRIEDDLKFSIMKDAEIKEVKGIKKEGFKTRHNEQM